MNVLIEKMFERRGYTPDYLKDIETQSHQDLMNVDVLCAKLHEYHTDNKKIVVLPDFDMDGIMSGTLGYAGLSELKFNVALFIPDTKDGHGFTQNSIIRLLQDYPDTKAILTCDTGTTCHEGIMYAQSLGIEVLVTDHHMEDGSPILADVIVNPMLQNEVYEHPEICGATVLYQCLVHYAKTYCPSQVKQIERLCVFAGIATVSDMMPVLYNNRQLVRDSIAVCRLLYSDDDWFVQSLCACPQYMMAFQGLQQVLLSFKERGKLNRLSDIDETFFGYYLSPMFNSVRRMDKDLNLAFDIFFASDVEININNLYLLNEERKILVQHYVETITKQDNLYAPYIYLTDASAGLLGLLANKFMRESGFPTLVLNSDSLNGSGRSPSWYDALDKFKAERFHVAGHQGAFGVGLEDKAELLSLYTFMNKDIHDTYLLVEETLSDVTYDYIVDTDGSGDSLLDVVVFKDFVRSIKYYKPFGIEFPAPVGLFSFASHEARWVIMGKEKQHVKLVFSQGFEILCWNSAHLIDNLMYQDKINIVGNFGENYYMDNHSVNFIGQFILDSEVEV